MSMVPRFLHSLLNRIKAPQYRRDDETFWQAQLRRSFKPRKRSVGKTRP